MTKAKEVKSDFINFKCFNDLLYKCPTEFIEVSVITVLNTTENNLN
jgi:hypothetical protein